MGRFYGLMIQAGTMSLEDVPKLWRSAVEAWLEENTREE